MIKREQQPEVVIVTSTRFSLKSRVDSARLACFSKMVAKATDCGYRVVCIDSSADTDLVPTALSSLSGHVTLLQEDENLPMATRRRMAMLEAIKSTSYSSHFVWLESQKYQMVTHISAMINTSMKSGADVVVSARSVAALKTHPNYMVGSELLVNLEISQLTGWWYDWMAGGPYVMTLAGARAFCQAHEDPQAGWAGIMLTLLVAHFCLGTIVASHPLEDDHNYPPELLEVECDNPDMKEKRNDQASQITAAIKKAWSIIRQR